MDNVLDRDDMNKMLRRAKQTSKKRKLHRKTKILEEAKERH